MANMRSKNRAFACHTKLPQLRRKYTIQSPMLQVFGEENFPSRFLRLRRIERCPLVQSKTALPFRGDEENMYPCLTIDEQSTILSSCQEVWKGFREGGWVQRAEQNRESKHALGDTHEGWCESSMQLLVEERESSNFT